MLEHQDEAVLQLCWEEGQGAYLGGQAWLDNPYAHDTEQAKYWWHGWRTTFKQQEKQPI
jgi:hypothetical protein